jgi:regulatory protein
MVADAGPGGPAAGMGPAGPVGRGTAGAPAVPGDPEQDLGDPESVARAICLRLLDDRPRTRAELAAALRRRGVPDEAAEAVLDRFTEVGLIDDDGFAAAWVDSRHAGRGLGRRALSAELRRKGVAAETVATAVERLDRDDETTMARALVQRRLRSLGGVTPEARLRRLLGLLARKGYPPGLAAQVVREVLAEQAAEAEIDVLDELGADG